MAQALTFDFCLKPVHDNILGAEVLGYISLLVPDAILRTLLSYFFEASFVFHRVRFLGFLGFFRLLHRHIYCVALLRRVFELWCICPCSIPIFNDVVLTFQKRKMGEGLHENKRRVLLKMLNSPQKPEIPSL